MKHTFDKNLAICLGGFLLLSVFSDLFGELILMNVIVVQRKTGKKEKAHTMSDGLRTVLQAFPGLTSPGPAI